MKPAWQTCANRCEAVKGGGQAKFFMRMRFSVLFVQHSCSYQSRCRSGEGNVISLKRRVYLYCPSLNDQITSECRLSVRVR